MAKRTPKPKIIKRYGVHNGNRFARVQFPDGTIKDVPIRKGRDGFEAGPAAEIIGVANSMRAGAKVTIDSNGDFHLTLAGGLESPIDPRHSHGWSFVFDAPYWYAREGLHLVGPYTSEELARTAIDKMYG